MNREDNYSKVVFDKGQTSGAFYERLNDYFPGVIFLYDLDRHRLRYVNKHVTSALGFSKEEILDDGNLSNLIYHEDLDLINSKIEEALTLNFDEELNFPCRLHHKEENCRYFSITLRVVEQNEGKESGSVLFFGRDITDEIKIEKEREELSELFRDTEELLQFGSWNWDVKTDQLEWTQGMYDLVGYSKRELPSVSGEFYFQLVSQEDKEKFAQVLEDAIANLNGFEHEYILKTKLGDERNVFTKGKVIANAKGEIKKIVGITRDITSLKNLERERERTFKELNRSNKELEEFAYVASHDLQEPLRKIATFNERLRKKFGDVLGPEGRAYLDRIILSTDNMRMLIDNLLEFSRITRSSQAFELCNLNTIIREAIADQELKIEETGCVIHVSNMPSIEAVPMELKQLFTNLIGNAIKFRKKDVTPTILIKAEKISRLEKNRFHLPVERGFFKIEVKDNGIGFEEEYSERIFQIFQRLHGKTEYAGSGIGLAICKKIVDNHEGTIFTQSKPGLGATFTLVLPEKQRG
jgi:PAS domain S-box-containing protein